MPTTTNYHTVEGLLLGETPPSGARLDYLTDGVGSVVATSDASALIRNEYRYAPYGRLTAQLGPDPDPAFLWTGETGSRSSGAAHAGRYNRARHYARETGRWTSVDPLWPGESAYGYVGGNPASRVDPSGRAVDCATECSAFFKKHPIPVDPKSGLPAGGTIICVKGQKCPCLLLDPKKYPPAYIKCVLEHEESHVPDVVCSKTTQPCITTFPDVAAQNKGECKAYQVSIKCLDKNCPAKGTDAGDWCHRAKCTFCESIKNRFCPAAGIKPSPVVKKICLGCGVKL